MTRFRVGITAILTCMAALAIVPSAFAHHGRISGSMDCQGVISYTASAWQTSNVPAKTHNDVRVYVTQSNGATVNPAQQVGSGQFNSANGFAFSGTFTALAGVNSVKLVVKEIGPWGNGSGSSNGNHLESSITVARPTSGCAPPPPTDVCPNIAGVQASVPAGMIKDASGNCVTPPPPPTDVCPNIAGVQASVPAGMIKDASGNCVTPPPPPTDECPNIQGNQASVPAGMIKDASGNCVTPPPPPAPLVTAIPAGTPLPATVTPPAATPTPAPKAKAKVKVKVKVKKTKIKAKKTVVKTKRVVIKKQATAKKTKPRALPFTP